MIAAFHADDRHVSFAPARRGACRELRATAAELLRRLGARRTGNARFSVGPSHLHAREAEGVGGRK